MFATQDYTLTHLITFNSDNEEQLNRVKYSTERVFYQCCYLFSTKEYSSIHINTQELIFIYLHMPNIKIAIGLCQTDHPADHLFIKDNVHHGSSPKV